jgi:predicted RNA binding protein YcfA (HicA-like mRNA interferase family)
LRLCSEQDGASHGNAESHRVLVKEGRPNFVFAFHDGEEIGSKMLARIARHTGLRPEDL